MNRTVRLENLSAAIDDELSEQDARTLTAWLEIHPEDLDDFREVVSVVALVRELPEVEPPADLSERILRAAARTSPVEVPREQALEWLDRYFDDELSALQRQVVEHYLAVDAEFAETARLHEAMLSALSEVDEEEPPADLAARIHASVDLPGVLRGAEALRRPVRPRRTAVYVRRVLTVSAALLALIVVGARVGRPGGAGKVATQPAPVVAPTTTGAPEAIPTAPPTKSVATLPTEPERPADDGNQPVVHEKSRPRVVAEPTRERRPEREHRVADRDMRRAADPVRAPERKRNIKSTDGVKSDSGRSERVTPRRRPGAPAPYSPELREGLAGSSSVEGSGSASVPIEGEGRSGSGDPLARGTKAPPF
jgi:anti-sigma factor RsiW